jgi:FtsH-binding integral membrane protein
MACVTVAVLAPLPAALPFCWSIDEDCDAVCVAPLFCAIFWLTVAMLFPVEFVWTITHVSVAGFVLSPSTQVAELSAVLEICVISQSSGSVFEVTVLVAVWDASEQTNWFVPPPAAIWKTRVARVHLQRLPGQLGPA